ncbi:MAG TPA: hypothetical protein VE964_03840, partial [Myxococcales bacterium]|nr:hypothetical protein [Myxococcales bacterium]
MSRGWKTFAIWALLLVLFFAFYSFFSRSPHTQWRTPEALEADLQSEEIASVTPEDGSLIIRKNDGSEYRVQAQLDADLWNALRNHDVPVQPARASQWGSFVVSWLPLVLVVVIFLFLFRKMGGGQGFLAMRKTTARLLPKAPSVSFADVGG